MTTPPPTSNLGSSRLLGTDEAQRAVDSLTRQVHNLERAVAQAVSAFQSMSSGVGRSGFSGTGTRWNQGSNFPNNNGGQTRFSTSYGNQTPMSAGHSNGGGGTFGAIGAMGGGRMAGGLALAAGAARGLVNYGNKTMSTNMQMDMFGTYSAMAGGVGNGGFRGANNTAMRAAFTNNANALNVTDAAAGAYGISNIFGNSQYGGKPNGGFTTGMKYAAGFGYANPTLGAQGTAQSLGQLYAPRSFYALGAYGIQNRQGGVPVNPNNIAGDLTQRLWGRSAVSSKTMAAGFQQGGYAAASLQAIGSQAGWSQTTIQAVQNLMTARNTAINGGMTATKFDALMQQANGGSRSERTTARAQLQKVGIGQSMFDTQKSLNATRVNRQEDILESLAPAFKDATEAVNHFSDALNSLLKNTGLSSLLGFGSGSLTPFSNALGGLGTGLGMGGGFLAARAMFGGGGGLLSSMAGMFARGGGTAASAGGMMTATRAASGAFNITSAGASSAASRALGAGGGLIGGLTTAGALFLVQGHSGHGLYGDYLERKNKDGYSKEDEVKYVMQWFKENKAEAAKRGWLYTSGPNKGHMKAGVDEWNTYMKELKVDDNLKQIAAAQSAGRLTSTDGRSGGASGGKSSGKKSGAGGNATGGSTANAASVIKFAEQQLGDPYVWGGTGPNGWDCSGLMQWAFGQAGVKLPRTSQEQQQVGKPVATDAVRPGDLLFNGNPAHHVVMAIGGGKIIEAPRTGLNVRIRSFKPGEFTNARRILGSVGNMGDISADATSATTLNDQQSTVGGNIGGGYGGTSELAALMSALSGGTGAGSAGLSAQSGSSASTADSAASTVSGSNPPGSPKGNKALGKQLAAKRGWTGNQWKALYNLWMGESGWNEKADNPSSDAYGIPQALPGKKMASAGADWKTNPATQIKWGLDYIAERYGNPAKAWSFWNSKNPHWYAEGAWNMDQDTTARVHKGEMILPAKQAESVRDAITNTMVTGTSTSGGGGIHFAAGSIVVQPQGPMTQAEAQTTAKMIVDAVTEDSRIKAMQKGY